MFQNEMSSNYQPVHVTSKFYWSSKSNPSIY